MIILNTCDDPEDPWALFKKICSSYNDAARLINREAIGEDFKNVTSSFQRLFKLIPKTELIQLKKDPTIKHIRNAHAHDHYYYDGKPGAKNDIQFTLFKKQFSQKYPKPFPSLEKTQLVIWSISENEPDFAFIIKYEDMLKLSSTFKIRCKEMIEKSKQNQIDPEAKKINDTLKRLLEP